jgi:DNA-directed RNA polymerase sigma subunit (sigma70/sigma32)
VLDALDALDDALAAANAGTARMRARVADLRDERAAGGSYTDIVAAEPAPRLVELLADATRHLDAAGAEVRRAQARALYEEGMTMDEIAAWFGVSRQRVSALLRSG